MKNIFSMVLILGLIIVLVSQTNSEELTDSLSSPEQHLNEVLTDALRCIKMTPNDLIFRDDYVDVDSFRLELIDKLMKKPLDLVTINSTIRSDWLKATPDERRFSLPFVWLKYLKPRGKTIYWSWIEPGPSKFPWIDNSFDQSYGRSIKKLPASLKTTLSFLFTGMKTTNSITQKVFDNLKLEEIACLRDSFPIILLEDVNDEFKTPEELDAQSDYEEKLTKRMIPYLAKIETGKLVRAGGNFIACCAELSCNIAGILNNEIRDRAFGKGQDR